MDWLFDALGRMARGLTRLRSELDSEPPRPGPLPVEMGRLRAPPEPKGRGTCPVDDTPLERMPELDVARCPTCAGHFVGPRHPSTSPELLALDRAERRSLGRRPYLGCPICGQQMARSNFQRVSGILIDRCPHHGTWFDPGEIRAVAAFLEAGGAARRAEFEAREARWLADQQAMANKWKKDARRAGWRRGRYATLLDDVFDAWDGFD